MTTLPITTNHAIRTYADKHGISYEQALAIIVTTGLQHIAMDPNEAANEHLDLHAELGRKQITPDDFPV